MTMCTILQYVLRIGVLQCHSFLMAAQSTLPARGKRIKKAPWFWCENKKCMQIFTVRSVCWAPECKASKNAHHCAYNVALHRGECSLKIIGCYIQCKKKYALISIVPIRNPSHCTPVTPSDKIYYR